MSEISYRLVYDIDSMRLWICDRCAAVVDDWSVHTADHDSLATTVWVEDPRAEASEGE